MESKVDMEEAVEAVKEQALEAPEESPEPEKEVEPERRPEPPGGLNIDDVSRQAVVLRKASAASPIRQMRYWLADLADAYDRCAKIHAEAVEADDEVALAIELAGSLNPGMKVVVEGLGALKLSRILRRDGDWALHLVTTEAWQTDANGRKRDVYENLAAMGSSPVVVWA